MKKLILIPFVLICAAALSQGIIKESLKIKSTILGKEVEFSIYLPPDYQHSERRYPVLYLLHGFSDDETGWVQYGEVKTIADHSIGNGELTPTIIAMPDAGVSWYANSADGKVKYEDFMVKEFIPYIDATYKTRATKQFRAVAGLSMGGMGTCIMAMKHPDLFSAAAPLSAATWTEEEIISMADDRWANAIGAPFGKDLKGQARLTDHFKSYSPLHLVLNSNADELKKVKYYIDCGDKDFLIKGNMALHAAMIDKNIPHEFRVRDGAHAWTYWRTALPEVFKFITKEFHR
jgi:S-formylglutathione hydrolase FrmB